MQRRRRHRWSMVLPGALLTLLVLGLAAPGVARGDCRHPADRPAFGLAIESAAAPIPSETGHPTPGPRPKPCDGPQCSGRSTLPPSLAVPEAPIRPDPWADPVANRPLSPPPLAFGTPSDASLPPDAPAGSIFHPPR